MSSYRDSDSSSKGHALENDVTSPADRAEDNLRGMAPVELNLYISRMQNVPYVTDGSCSKSTETSALENELASTAGGSANLGLPDDSDGWQRATSRPHGY